MQVQLLRFAVTAVMGALLAAGQPATADDWNYWRGPRYDGTSRATGLPDSWDADGGEGSNLLWKQESLGGRSTPIVMDGRLYTILRAEPGTRREGEKVVCADTATGQIVWENRFNVWLSDVPAERVGWSSVVGDPETGNVYALGVSDYFLCIDGKTGKTLWDIPLHEQFGMLSTYGGRTNFPVISGDLVIISGVIINYADKAKPNHRLIAMDKRTGEIVWFSGTRDLPDDTTYSSPSVVTINGQEQLILGAGDGAVWSFQPQTGRPLWHYDLSRRGLFATPLVVGNRVYCSHSEENITGSGMGAVAALEVSGTGEDTQVKELWKIEEIVSARSAPVLIDNRLYLVDDRCKLWVIDADTGNLIAERMTLGDRKQWSSLLHADGKIYVLTENGNWVILKPTEDGAEIVSKGRIRDESFLGSPIVADGRLFFPGTSAMYCVGNAAAQPDAAPASEATAGGKSAAADQPPVSENPDPAWALIVPAESVLKPGEKLPLTVRLFNRLGQPLGEADQVQFTVDGPGEIKNGSFVAPSETSHQMATIHAKVGDVTAETRVRIIPELPWRFDFDQATDAPSTWVGARYRHVIRTVDGSPALVKVSTIPKGTRSRLWMGPSELANYTVTADVKAQEGGQGLPDMGLIAQGYVLDLQGTHQKLQVRTWAAQLRIAQSVEFPWQAGVWYRLKLQASVEDGPVAVVRGKVWPKDQPEPKEWTVEARDESPNLTGSPGLFGNATLAEVYYDNVEVTPNQDQ